MMGFGHSMGVGVMGCHWEFLKGMSFLGINLDQINELMVLLIYISIGLSV